VVEVLKKKIIKTTVIVIREIRKRLSLQKEGHLVDDGKSKNKCQHN
jgi:hypothetical protein